MRSLLWLVIGLLVAGCQLTNQDPLILSINGIKPRSMLGLRYTQEPLFTEVGTTLDIELEVSDPDNDPTFVWWAASPPGWDFPPEGRSGTWTVPEDYWQEWVELYPVVTDDRDPAGTDMVWMAIYVEGAIVPVEDTGGYDTGQ